jgi:WG containing repeat
MFKNFTITALLIGGFSGYAQNNASVRNDGPASTGEIAGVTKAIRNVEAASTARLQSILSLKKALNDGLNLNTVDSSLNKAGINAAVFNNYLKNLDNKYQEKFQALSKDAVSDLDQYAEKSTLQRFYSKGISSSCYANVNKDEFLKIKDTDGEEIIGFELDLLRANTRYGLVDNYKQGFARIKKDQVFGFLNLCGEEVVPCQYENAEPFNDGKALVKKFVWYFVDVNGNESDELENILDAKTLRYGFHVAKFKNNKFAIIDNNYDVSKKAVSSFYDQIEEFNEEENLFRVRNGKSFGVIRINGKGLIDLTYDKIETESNKWISVERNKKVGLLDINGTVRINPAYETIETVFVNPAISKSLSPVVVKDEAGFKIYELSNNKISSNFSSLGVYNNFGLAKACATKGAKQKCGYINYEGSEIIPIIHDDVSEFSKYGLVVAKDKYENCTMPEGSCQADVIYSKDGRIVLDKSSPTRPNGIKFTLTDTLFTNSLVIVRANTSLEKGNLDGVHLINKVSHEVITQQSYLVIKRFGDDMIAALAENEKWGVIDYAGKYIIKPTYKEILHVSEGLFGVKYDNNKLGYVDRKGKVQIPFEYSDIKPFQGGLAIVAKGGKFGIITKFSAKIAPCVFKEITPMAGGNFELVDASSTKYILNSNGDCQTNCAKFDDIRKKANN